MAKREIIGMSEAWWVWLGEQPAIRVATEVDAASLMLAQGSEYGIANSHNRCDMASPVVEVLWNVPLHDGKNHHKTVISPVLYILYKAKLRKVIQHLSPSKLASVSKGWEALEPKFPAWWPRQYHEAINDPEALVIRGKKPLELQLAARWPQP